MDIDIGFWLTVVVLVAVLLWALDRWLVILPRGEGAEAEAAARRWPWALRETVEFSNSILPVLLVVLVVRSFLFEPFTIPSGSMLPSLRVHDFILVNKFAYGVRLPAVHTRILDTGAPARGDIVVFRYPKNPSVNYIKRVVGLPGDQIRVAGGELYVNGEQVSRREIARRTTPRGQEVVFVETLDGNEYTIQHQWLVNPYTGALSSRSPEGQWRVPEDSYFVIGDNRDNSQDSRFWGFVPESHIAGEAVLIWMHWPSLFSLPDFSRVGVIDKVEDRQ